MKEKLYRFLDNHTISSFLTVLLSVFLGLFIGLIILLISNPSQALAGFSKIISGGFAGGVHGIGQTLYFATPLIMTGLSVGFAFKTGLFNIGVSGQFLVGGFTAVVIGLKCPFLGPFHWIVALLGAALAGALWSLLPGILRAFRNVNIVISCIMMNYIGMYLVNYLVKTIPGIFNLLRNEAYSPLSSSIIPKMGLNAIFPTSSVNGGIIIAIVIAVIVYIVLNKTTFGYELKACGFNKDAAQCAGINGNRNIILSMLIAGALAGIAGGLVYLAGVGRHIEIIDTLPTEGFSGISVALLGLSNPLAIIASGIFIAYLNMGGFYMQLHDFVPQIIDIIIATIIYTSSLSLAFAMVIDKVKYKLGGKRS